MGATVGGAARSAGYGCDDSANLEAVEPLGLLVGRLDMLDVRAARALVHEAHHAVDAVVVALEDRLDRAVRAVGHPARHAGIGRLAANRVTEEHALDAAVRDGAYALHAATAVSARNSYAMFAARSAVT